MDSLTIRDCGPSEMDRLTIRDCRDADMPSVTAIYGHWVTVGLASFELDPPDLEEMLRRRAAIVAGGLPYVVAETGEGVLLGYAYASHWRTRAAYRFSCEDSVYVDRNANRRGVGRALLGTVIERCTAQGLRMMMAVIGDSDNAPSIGLHRACGFAPVGILPAIGWKHGRWVDSVLMSRPLGEGNTTQPED